MKISQGVSFEPNDINTFDELYGHGVFNEFLRRAVKFANLGQGNFDAVFWGEKNAETNNNV